MRARRTDMFRVRFLFAVLNVHTFCSTLLLGSRPLAQPNASRRQHVSFVTLLTCSSSRATTLFNYTIWLESAVPYHWSWAHIVHRTQLTAVKALGFSGIIHQPQAYSYQLHMSGNITHHVRVDAGTLLQHQNPVAYRVISR